MCGYTGQKANDILATLCFEDTLSFQYKVESEMPVVSIHSPECMKNRGVFHALCSFIQWPLCSEENRHNRQKYSWQTAQ